MALHEVVRREIVSALTRSQGDMGAAARELEIGRTTLWRKMGEFEILGSEYGCPHRRSNNRAWTIPAQIPEL